MDSRFVAELERIGLRLTEEQLAEIEIFEDDLYVKNEVMNVTRISKEESWTRHFIDSLLFHDLIPEGSTVLDLGTGPGFPSWPLALARPDLTLTALDSNSKMIAFLKQHPLPNLTPVEGRAEEYPHLHSFDVVTGRAVAPFAIQMEISVPFAKVGGLILPLRTPKDAAEVERFPHILGADYERSFERMLPVVEAPRMVPVYRKVERSPKGYPRRWGDIKRFPL